MPYLLFDSFTTFFVGMGWKRASLNPGRLSSPRLLLSWVLTVLVQVCVGLPFVYILTSVLWCQAHLSFWVLTYWIFEAPPRLWAFYLGSFALLCLPYFLPPPSHDSHFSFLPLFIQPSTPYSKNSTDGGLTSWFWPTFCCDTWKAFCDYHSEAVEAAYRVLFWGLNMGEME